MRYLFLALLFLLSSVFAQTHKIDSLKSRLNTVKSDTAKVDILNNLSKLHLSRNLHNSLEYAEKAFTLAQTVNDKPGMALAHQNMASVYGFQGNHQKAVEYARQALALGEELENQQITRSALYNLGYTYLDLGDNEKALTYISRILAMAQKCDDKSVLANALHHMAIVYNALKDYDNVLKYSEKSLKLKENLDADRDIAYTLGMMGVAYRSLGDPEKSIPYFKQALAKLKNSGDKFGMIYSLCDLGISCRQVNRPEESLAYLKKSLALAKEVHFDDEIITIYEELSKTYQASEEYQQALKYHKFFKEYSDSLYEEKNVKRIARVRSQHAIDQKEQKIQLFEKEKQIQKMDLERQMNVKNFLLAALLLILIITILIYNLYRLKNKAVNIERNKNLELEKINAALSKEIAERKEMEKALRESQEMLRLILDNIPQRIFWKDRNLNYLGCNKNFVQDAGVSSPDDVIGKTDYDLWKKEEADFFHKCDRRVIESNSAEYHIIEPLRRANGEQAWLETNKIPLHNADGDVVGVLGSFDIVTDRIRMENALAEEKEKLAVTVGSIGDGVISTDINGKIILLNKVAETLTGWTQSESVGEPVSKIFQIVEGANRQPVNNLVEKILEPDQTSEFPNNLLLIDRQGHEKAIEVSNTPLRDTENKIIGAVFAFRDVTEKRKMEEELLKTQKLESIGIFAGGIAHDFNNILTGILANISFARWHSATDIEKLHERLEAAENACYRARDLTQQLLTFSKIGTPVKQTVSLDKLLNSSANFALHGSNVRCEFDIATDLWPTEIDEGQINQVLNNLILNADQAMPEGGTINLIAENFERHNDPNLPLPAGKYIKITIKDQGVGIPKQHLKKIFDPYFTTKSKGSGLGLANTYSIIKKHNGLIEAESEAGKGATFTIYLPASPNQPVPSPEQAEPMVEGEGKVLVMDDDMVISEVFETMLKRLGYRVYLTRHGSETVDLYKQAKTNDSPFDAVILDLTIPGGMGGKETMRELLKLDPEVRAIVCSGYTNHPVLSNYKDYGFKGCIVKPFNLESIGKALGQTLHKHHQN